MRRDINPLRGQWRARSGRVARAGRFAGFCIPFLSMRRLSPFPAGAVVPATDSARA